MSQDSKMPRAQSPTGSVETASMISTSSPARIRAEAEAETTRIRATALALNEIATKAIKDALVDADRIVKEATAKAENIKEAAYVEAARIITEANARVRN